MLTGGNFAADVQVISIDQTTMSDITADALNALIEQNLPAAIIAVNVALTNGVKLPDDIQGINLSDATLDFKTGFLAAGLTPTVNGWKALGAYLSGTKQALLAAKMPEAPISIVQF